MPTPPRKTRRKKPICRQCGTRMVGHKRVQGSPICPQKLSSLISPPQSPTRPPIVQSPLAPFDFVPDPAFYTKLNCGTLRRVNPNFVDKKVPIPELLRLSASSLVPTVLVDDDGNTIRGSNGGDPASDDDDDDDDDDYEDEEEDDEEDEDECCLDNTLLDRIRQPMLTIFRTKDKDLAQMQETAVRMGVHYGIMTPPNTPPNKKLHQKSTQNSALTRVDDSWWVVMGRNASFVQEVIDSCQKGMPGTIAKDSELIEPFRTTTFLQLVFAGLVGGCVVVCGLSML